METIDLQTPVCNAYSYLSNVLDYMTSDDGEDISEEIDLPCTANLFLIVGELQSVHALLHLGMIVSPEMEDVIEQVLDHATYWYEEHSDVLADYGLSLRQEQP